MQASDSKTTVLLRRPGYVMKKAVSRPLPFLESQPDLSDIDAVLCEYIELQWARGESLLLYLRWFCQAYISFGPNCVVF